MTTDYTTIMSVFGIPLPTGYSIKYAKNKDGSYKAYAIDSITADEPIGEFIGEDALSQAATAIIRTELSTLLYDLRLLENKELPTFGDFADIYGHAHVKRAIEVAVAGGHSLLITGCRGVGKRTLLRAIPPLLVVDDAGPHTSIVTPELDTAEIGALLATTQSGIVLLERLEEYSAAVLALLVPYIESKQSLVVASKLPCPCGYYNDQYRECSCSVEQVSTFAERFSTLEAAFAMHIEAGPISAADIAKKHQPESTHTVRERVQGAQEEQVVRYKTAHQSNNAQAITSLKAIAKWCALDSSAQALIKAVQNSLHPGMEQLVTYHAVARTIADLAESTQIQANHIAEAVQYRHHRTL